MSSLSWGLEEPARSEPTKGISSDKKQHITLTPPSEGAFCSGFDRPTFGCSRVLLRKLISVNERAWSFQGVEAATISDARAVNVWLRDLPDRAVDVLSIHTAVAKAFAGDPADANLTWNLGTSLDWPRVKLSDNGGSMGCITRHAIHWHCKRRRPLSGYEQLLVQGFPEDIQVTGEDAGSSKEVRLSDRQLRQLSGDTQPVPVVGSLLVTMLCNACMRDDVGCAPPSVNTAIRQWRVPERALRLGPRAVNVVSRYDDVVKFLHIEVPKRRLSNAATPRVVHDTA